MSLDQQHEARPLKVLVIGATGGTGKIVAQKLIDEGIGVRIAARNVPKARKIFGDQVDVVKADLGRSEGWAEAFKGVNRAVLTAAVPAGPASDAAIRTIDYEGTIRCVEAAQQSGFKGHFLYMTTQGIHTSSLFVWLLNLIKGGHFREWRRKAEAALLASGLSVVLIRAPALTNGKERSAMITPGDRALSFFKWMSRRTVAEVIVSYVKKDTVSSPVDISVE